MRDFLLAIWRNAARERGYALINLAGLALGFACCLLLALFLYGELTYDRHFENHARIYRVGAEITQTAQGLSRQTAWVPRAGAPMMAADNPQIEAFVRFTDASLQDGLRLHYGAKVFNWRHTYFADASVFQVFSHHVLAGDPGTALTQPSSVAISATLARAYFGDADPIGQLLRTDAGENWKVTLVFADLPPNTHLRYDALFADNIPLLRDAENQAGLRAQLLTGFSAYTYLLMRPGFDRAQWSRFTEDFVKRYIADDARRAGQSLHVLLQPLTSIHYAEPLLGDQESGNRVYLYGCAGIALLILAVACINYTNLATARALRRARSVGIRKILGARRGRLLLECMGEAVVYALVAAVIALALAEVALSLTPVGELLGGRVHLDLSGQPRLLAAVLGGASCVGLIAGLYPSLYLSSWMPAAAFMTRGGGAASGARLREVLVLLQFVMATAVVAVTLVMAAQMRYVAQLPLGYRHDNQILVTVRGTDKFPRIPALARQLQSNPQVLAVAQTTLPPGRFDDGGFAQVEDAAGRMQPLQVAAAEVSAGFIKALGIELVAGKDFDTESPADEVLVNETLVRSMGWKDPVGRHVDRRRVVGVVRDFHFRSLREPIRPLVITLLNDDPARVAEARRPFIQRVLLIRVSGRDFAGTVQYIQKVMTGFDPGNPFEYMTLDDSLRSAYDTERRMLSLIGIFAALCIFISCLGLFGLTAYATERRAREIAIRKVLGASVWQVVLLLARRILLLIGIGGIVAAIGAWLAMDEWLASFAYRVGINPLLLILAMLLAAGMALATVALQSLRTARSDPADALRYE